MTNNQNQPKQYDAVLGGNAPPPIHSAVLGGIEGVKKRLASSDVDVQIKALNDVLNYGDEGLDLVVDALQTKPRIVRKSAYRLLRDKNVTKAEKMLWHYGVCYQRVYETLNDEYMYLPFEEFYNREVKVYDSKIGIDNTDNNAYVIDENNFDSLLKEPLGNKIEALIFRGEYPSSFIFSSNIVSNFKALFIGAYEISNYNDIYFFPIWNISLILKAYPKLEFLQLRCGENYSRPWRYFKKFRHNHLRTLILETKGLSSQKITQILTLNFPALEHLELWIGGNYSYGNYSIEHLTPILSGKIFPKLYYLGLRDCGYADEIAEAIVDSPIINKIKILDLSMGYLTDEGATALLNCPAINDLDILNVANNCLSKEMVDKLMQLDTEVVADNQDIHKIVSNRYEEIWE